MTVSNDNKPFTCLNCNVRFNEFSNSTSKKEHFANCQSDNATSQVDPGMELDDESSAVQGCDDFAETIDDFDVDVESIMDSIGDNESGEAMDYDSIGGYDSPHATELLTEADDMGYSTSDLALVSSASASDNQERELLPRDIYFSTEDDQLPPNVQASLDIFAEAKKGGLARDSFDSIIKIFNSYVETTQAQNEQVRPLLSHYRCKFNMIRRFPVQPSTYRACPGGCKMFLDDNHEETCGVCKRDLYEEDAGSITRKKSLASSVKQLSIRDQLALLVYDRKTRELLRHRAKRDEYVRQTDTDDDSDDDETDDESAMTDIFDGKIYKKAVDTFFRGELDIAVSLYTDGFQKFDAMTIVHFQVLNFPLSCRTEQKYMLQSCIIPGPRAPVDLFSFLQPAIDEFQELESRGMRVWTQDGPIVVRASLFYCGGDIPAVAKMCNHASHNHQFGCRVCFVDKFDVSTRNYAPRDRTAAYRAPEHYGQDGSFQNQHFREAMKKLGQNGPTPFAALRIFHGPSMFPLDYMHLFGYGCGKQIVHLLLGSDYTVDSAKAPIRLNTQQLRSIDAVMGSSMKNLPSTFSSNCSDITKQSKYFRAIDYLHFMRFVLPTIIVEVLTDTHRQAVLALADIVQRASSRTITESDIQSYQESLKTWHKWLSKQVDDKAIAPNIFTVSQHYLTHIPYMLRRMGPLVIYSAFAMERAIGATKKRIRSRKLPGVNAGNIMLELAMERRLERIGDRSVCCNQMETENEQMNVLSEDDADVEAPELWAPFTTISLQALGSVYEVNLIKKITDYYMVFEGRNISVSPNDEVKTAKRMWKKNGIVFGSSSPYGGSTRKNNFVRLRLTINTNRQRNNRVQQSRLIFYGEVMVYFQHYDGDAAKLLALVKVYEAKKSNDSGTWPYRTDGAAWKYTVANVKRIKQLVWSVESTSKRHYFCWAGRKRDNELLGELRYLW